MSPKRRSARSNTSIELITIIILVVVGLYNFLTGKGPDTTLPPATATAPVVAAPTSANASSSWWEVYFTDPQHINNPQDWQGSIEGRLIEKINAAQKSIHIASFEFDLDSGGRCSNRCQTARRGRALGHG